MAPAGGGDDTAGGDAAGASPGAAAVADGALDRDALHALPFFFVNALSATAGAALFARWMESDAYGGFIFAVHVLGLVALVGGLGFPQSVVRFLPRYRQGGEPHLYRGFLAAGLGVQVVGGALVGGLAWAALALAEWEGHSSDSLTHAWWLVPVLGLNVFLAGVDKSAGRLRTSAVAHGLARHAVAIVVGWWVVMETGGLSAAEAILVFGGAAGLVVVFQAAGRWRQGDRLAPRRFEMSPWLKVSTSMGVIWGLRILGASGEVMILRLVVGETEAGAFHLAVMWGALVAVPALTYTAAASRTIAGSEQAEAGRLATLALHRAVIPTVLTAAVVYPLAGYFLNHPDETHQMAEGLLLPLVLVWALRGLEALMLSGLALRGMHARATGLASAFTGVVLAVAVALAYVGVAAVAWGVLAVRAVFLVALWLWEGRP